MEYRIGKNDLVTRQKKLTVWKISGYNGSVGYHSNYLNLSCAVSMTTVAAAALWLPLTSKKERKLEKIVIPVAMDG